MERDRDYNWVKYLVVWSLLTILFCWLILTFLSNWSFIDQPYKDLLNQTKRWEGSPFIGLAMLIMISFFLAVIVGYVLLSLWHFLDRKIKVKKIERKAFR